MKGCNHTLSVEVSSRVSFCLDIIKEEMDKIAESVGHVSYEEFLSHGEYLKKEVEKAYQKRDNIIFISNEEATLYMKNKLNKLKER
jgi:uncharacterized protein YehS (DUF1456 family)